MSLINSSRAFEGPGRGGSLSLTRRELLKASAGLGIGSAVAAGAAVGAPWAASPPLPGLPKGFSRAERDRRWKRVRDMMRREGLDCILTPVGDADAGSDSRYLTQCRGWTVFPHEGPVTAVVDGEDVERLKRRQDWVSDIRPADDGLWSPPIIEALRELKMSRARIGVGRLDKVLRNQEGDVNYTTLDRIRQAFPGARFESAYDQMMRIKLLRSDEEIHVLERAVAACELGVRAMIETTRPGVLHKDVWLSVFTALTAATREAPSRLAIVAGDEANGSSGGPRLDVFQAGQIMNQEISGYVLGYRAQVNHSICIGGPPPRDWPSAAQYCIDLFQELVEWIKPGKGFTDLCRLYAQRAGARGGELRPSWVLVHTCGFGDGPRMGPGRTETPDLMIEPTMVFTIKPRVVIKDARMPAQFGDALLVTEQGARRLGRRKLEATAVGA